MDLLCKVCDCEIIDNESEHNNYIATLRKKNHKCFYKQYTINNNNLDEFDKKLGDDFSHHNKKISFDFIGCEFKTDIDNNFTAKKKKLIIIITQILKK